MASLSAAVFSFEFRVILVAIMSAGILTEELTPFPINNNNNNGRFYYLSDRELQTIVHWFIIVNISANISILFPLLIQ